MYRQTNACLSFLGSTQSGLAQFGLATGALVHFTLAGLGIFGANFAFLAARLGVFATSLTGLGASLTFRADLAGLGASLNLGGTACLGRRALASLLCHLGRRLLFHSGRSLCASIKTDAEKCDQNEKLLHGQILVLQICNCLGAPVFRDKIGIFVPVEAKIFDA